MGRPRGDVQPIGDRVQVADQEVGRVQRQGRRGVATSITESEDRSLVTPVPPTFFGTLVGHLWAVREMDPKDPSTLYAEGPVASEPAEPPEDDVPAASPLRDSGGTGPGPDDRDWMA